MDDEALVRAARSGDLAATEALLARHQRLAYTTALRLLGEPAEAEDIAQDALIRAFTHLADLRDEETFTPWLRRITVNLSLSVLRRRGQLRIGSLDADDAASADPPVTHEVVDEQAHAPEAAALRGELLAEVEVLLARLPDAQRSALLLRDAYDYDVTEIAALQGCGLSAAKM